MYCGAVEFVCTPSMIRHVPVLLEESMGFLQPENGGRFADLTYGGGGHSEAILEASDSTELMSFDCDPDALIRSENTTNLFGDRFTFHDLSFQKMDEVSSAEDFDGVLMDLGISSFQLMEPLKGFSFRLDAPIDMRLDPRVGQSAAEFLETASRESLVRAVREYGEERRWSRVVNAILEARGTGVLQRTMSAAELVSNAVGGFRIRQRIHPATKTFQGIRIAINGEMEALALTLPKAFRALKPGGVLVVISFHSLEDRMVKRFMRKMAGRPVHRWDRSVLDDRKVCAELLNTKIIAPSSKEVEENPRSRSARLRVLKKIEQPNL
ncbi:MAG: 16S rRNA (cytosine(1402)-N(4))-methyltransferase RsmH [Opitutales bacterium]|jgi:16S rRNA (cytosine1402-N4)-methyltransferase|tara:strand:- start:305 stop:1276 length:972 start_codon:yes stop_codon:yes gene_type:complete